ncbi:DUF2514 family protein [Hafnia paralvei]|nr:DUF2514 family protein [Hafnia paralvei]MCK2180216.1 DUF2514 domain-containing protein [Hafnia paralvei]
MLSELNEAARDYVKEADRAYSVGRTCEQKYDSVVGIK